MTVRILGPHERGRFTREAWGHLLALQGAGMLSHTDLEHVIERAMSQIDGPIALDDLRGVLHGTGLEADVPGDDTLPIH